MTREEQIYEASIEYSENEVDKIISSNSLNSFISGAKWSDNNPKSPWISIKDDLPCNHSELICGIENTEGVETIDVFAANQYGHIQTDYMVYENGKWLWNDFTPDFWMIAPKVPK